MNKPLFDVWVKDRTGWWCDGKRLREDAANYMAERYQDAGYPARIVPTTPMTAQHWVEEDLV